jgi:hypothetical protein
MMPKKTPDERQRELQELIRTREGREELETLALRYDAASGRVRVGKTSLITNILVHEREKGLIAG